MRLLAVLVDAARNKKGGGLAAGLHAHTMHGNPFSRTLTTRITRQVPKHYYYYDCCSFCY
jgi:hypothetical protein